MGTPAYSFMMINCSFLLYETCSGTEAEFGLAARSPVPGALGTWSPFWLLTASCYSGRPQQAVGMAQAAELRPPTWESWVEFPALGFSSAQPWISRAAGGMHQWMGALISEAAWFFLINHQKIPAPPSSSRAWPVVTFTNAYCQNLRKLAKQYDPWVGRRGGNLLGFRLVGFLWLSKLPSW